MRLDRNPYRWNQVDIQTFHGRAELLHRMLQGLRRGDSFAVVGGRRIGKSMLLRKLEAALSAEISVTDGVFRLPVYLSTQQLRQPLGPDSIYAAILLLVERGFASVGVGKFADGALLDILKRYREEENRGFKEALLTASRAVPMEFRLVVLIDEMEPILAAPWAHGFCDNWRQLLTNEPEVSILLTSVVTGAKGLWRISTDIGSPLSNVLIWKQLGVFCDSDTSELISRPTLNVLTPEFEKIVARLTGGHPFLIQYLMSIVAEHDLDDASEVIYRAHHRFFEEQVTHFRLLWAHLDDAEKRVYALMVTQNREFTLRQITEVVGGGLAEPAVENLCNSGIAKRCIGGETYTVAGEMFRDWFLRATDKPHSQQTCAASHSASGSRSVFLVHGHDESLRESVARFLEKLGLIPIILGEQANSGRTIIEKFEEYADVPFAVVLLTGDDVGTSVKAHAANSTELSKRARQNVVFELGYFSAKLGRNRVCTLYTEGVELPSDVNGMAYVPLDARGSWKLDLAKELVAAGIEVDLNRVLAPTAMTE